MTTPLPGASNDHPADTTLTRRDQTTIALYIDRHAFIGGADALLELSDAGMRRILAYDLDATLRVVADGNPRLERNALNALIEHLDTGRVDGSVYYETDTGVGRGCLIGICAVGAKEYDLDLADELPEGRRLDLLLSIVRRVERVASDGNAGSLATEVALHDLYYHSPRYQGPYSSEQQTRIYSNLRAVAAERLAALNADRGVA